MLQLKLYVGIIYILDDLSIPRPTFLLLTLFCQPPIIHIPSTFHHHFVLFSYIKSSLYLLLLHSVISSYSISFTIFTTVSSSFSSSSYSTFSPHLLNRLSFTFFLRFFFVSFSFIKSSSSMYYVFVYLIVSFSHH